MQKCYLFIIFEIIAIITAEQGIENISHCTLFPVLNAAKAIPAVSNKITLSLL